MSKQVVRIVTVLAVALAVALPAFAKGKGEGKGGKPVEGTVTAVDTTANTVTIKTADGDKVIKTDANTKIRIPHNKGATLADLKNGTEVKVTCKDGCATAISAGGGKHEKKNK